jgi:methionyl-tRNA formyltransferase
MLMDPGLDSGPILSQRAVPVGPDDDALGLEHSLARLGAALLAETLPRWAAGEVAPRPQDPAQATYAPKIRREDAVLVWTLPAEELARRVRAYRAWPVAHTSVHGEPLKVLRAEALAAADAGGPPGTMTFPFRAGRRPGPPAVRTGDGLLVLHQVNPAGRAPMSGEEFARGRPDLEGLVLGADA